MPQSLIIVAVEAELAALRPKLGLHVPIRLGPYIAQWFADRSAFVLVGGIGPAESAAATAAALSANPNLEIVISAGIAGAFEASGAKLGDIVVATRTVFADLGAHSPEKFLDAQALGWPGSITDCDAETVNAYAKRIQATGLRAHTGMILTVAAATGTAARAAELYAKYNPIAEAMEGAGVAAAARKFSVLSPQSSVLRFVEVRAISNTVGERNLPAWDIPGALKSLATAMDATLS